ncbi:MAG: hypothetical protein JST92_17740 [Deltaproteobacteria bacterium]|nr:hypothetical protein [Deltaproteobacteria bacterium]
MALMFGAESPADAYAGNWMPFHELFHLGNPRVATKVRWFLEGSATYYQDVLRARAGVRTADEMWGDLWDGLRRFCDPMHGDSLHVESENLRHTHRWMEVYWGGACLFFRADVAIRARSNGAESLDTLLRAMRKDAEQVPLTEEQLIQRLDAAAGQPIAHTMVDTSQPLPGLAETLELLGVHPTGPESVTFAQAPQSWIRDAIFAPDGVGRGPTSGPRSSGSPR